MNYRGVLISAVLVIAAMGGLFLRQQEMQTASTNAPTAADILADQIAAGAAKDPAQPAFRLADVDGVYHELADWNGHPRLVNFWATWCAPCRREIPLLKSLQQVNTALGLQVIGVAVDELEPVAMYAENAKFNYPILVGQEDAMDAAEAFGIDFIALPFTFVVASDGQLLATHIGELLPADAEEIIAVLSRLSSGEIDVDAARNTLTAL
jgi:thiol-disulfide isomerase/thioredoxin